MKCPYCKADEDKVVDSRSCEGGQVIRRRRECIGCNRRFTTYERVEASPLRVIKKDGNRTDFDREKVRRGILKACQKRPISAEQIDSIMRRIESAILDCGEREINTEFIGEIVMRELRRLDHVAYVRFASVYREFRDIDDFIDELNSIRGSKPRIKRKK